MTVVWAAPLLPAFARSSRGNGVSIFTPPAVAGRVAAGETQARMLSYDQPFVNAVAFAGGSSYGLAVATGAADEIKATTQNPTQWENIATVVGAIIFDVGGRRFSQVTPDYESLYLPRRQAVGLLPVAQGEFLIQGERPGRLRFTRSQEGGVTGLILNPGPWGIPATRLP